MRADGSWATPPNTTYNNATTTVSGLMSAGDKVKLNGIADNANNYSLPNATSTTLGGVKIGSNIGVSNGTISFGQTQLIGAINTLDIGTGEASINDYLIAQYSNGGSTSNDYFRRPISKIITASAVKNALATSSTMTTSYLRGDGTWATPPNTTYSVATTTANGLMSSADKTKLNGIASNATAVTEATVSNWGFIKTASVSASTIKNLGFVQANPSTPSGVSLVTVTKNMYVGTTSPSALISKLSAGDIYLYIPS